MPYAFPNKEKHIKNNLSFFAPGDTLTVYFGHASDDEDVVFSRGDVPAYDRVFRRYAKSLGKADGFTRADVVRSRIEYVAGHARVPVRYVRAAGDPGTDSLAKPAVVVMCDPSVASRPVAIAHPIMYLGKSFAGPLSLADRWVTACNDALHETMHLFGASHEAESGMLLTSFQPNWDAFLSGKATAKRATERFGYTGANHFYDAWYMLKNQVRDAPYDADFSTEFDPSSCTGVGVPALYSFFTPTHPSVEKPPDVDLSRLFFLSKKDKLWLREMYDPVRKLRMNKISRSRDGPPAFLPRRPINVVSSSVRLRLRENDAFVEMLSLDTPSALRSWILDGVMPETLPFAARPFNPPVDPVPDATAPPPLADDSSDDEVAVQPAPYPPPDEKKKCCTVS